MRCRLDDEDEEHKMDIKFLRSETLLVHGL